MNEKENNSEMDPDLRPSNQFAADLAGLFGKTPTVPAGVDDAVMAMARRRLAGRRLGRIARWASAAAAAAAVVMVTWVALGPSWGVRARRAAAPAVDTCETPVDTSIPGHKDIDSNGRVNILDAFALARTIEATGERRREWDFNGDGAVNRQDADVIAMAAVSLKGGAIR